MPQTVREVMTSDPVVVESRDTLTDVARRMKEADTGAIIVLTDGQVAGIVTDRDITVRAVAEGKGPDTPVQQIVSSDLETVSPDYSVDQAIQLMRSRAVRRLPVVQDGHPVGIVSIGDLAVERDPDSTLADISAARGNE